jgi:excisionase family DNA binding protein
MTEPNALISSKDAAERLGVTERYVATLIDKGEITAQRFGRNAWAIDPASVEAYKVRKQTGQPLEPKEGAGS